MNITDVRVRKMTKESKMKAVVSITIDDEFVIHDIKVVEGEKGLFIAMPSRKAADGEYRDIAHPINSQTRNSIQEIVLAAYEKALLESQIQNRHNVNWNKNSYYLKMACPIVVMPFLIIHNFRNLANV